jgi:hypothetical protein
MKKKLLYLTFLVWATLATSTRGYAQVGTNEFTISRKAEISLQGEGGNYRYTIDRLEGRFNRQLKRFEFRMPMGGVRSDRNPADLSVLKSIFLFSPDAMIGQSDLVQLWVYVPDNTRNFTEYRNARTITLPADLIVNGNTYRTPVAMNLFYSAGILKYGLDLNMRTPLETASSSSFAGNAGRKLQVLVRDSEMNIAYTE